VYRSDSARAAMVVAHGAGAGQTSPFMVRTARGLSGRGISAATFDFPYVTAGRSAPDRPDVLERAWRDAIAAARAELGALPLFIGGKSMGGRISSQVAARGIDDLRGLVFLGYPLHPPGKADRVRDEHLYGIDVPMLFLQGTRDPFADPDVLAPVLAKLGATATHHRIEGGGHSLERSRKDDPREVGASLAPIVAAWIAERITR
jgi:predicted alpha/beta-hydrolase family hydrolase